MPSIFAIVTRVIYLRKNKLLNYFTYGRHIEEKEEHYDSTNKRNRKNKMKKRHLNKLSNMNNLRRSSRRGSLAINFFNESGSRRRSNASSTGGHRISKDFGSSRRITGEKDHSSDLGSDMSRDQSRT